MGTAYSTDLGPKPPRDVFGLQLAGDLVPHRLLPAVGIPANRVRDSGGSPAGQCARMRDCTRAWLVACVVATVLARARCRDAPKQSPPSECPPPADSLHRPAARPASSVFIKARRPRTLLLPLVEFDPVPRSILTHPVAGLPSRPFSIPSSPASDTRLDHRNPHAAAIVQHTLRSAASSCVRLPTLPVPSAAARPFSGHRPRSEPDHPWIPCALHMVCVGGRARTGCGFPRCDGPSGGRTRPAPGRVAGRTGNRRPSVPRPPARHRILQARAVRSEDRPGRTPGSVRTAL